MRWLKLLNIIGGGEIPPPLLIQGLLSLPKLFIMRQTQDDLLKEQNRLIGLLIAHHDIKAANPPQQIVYVDKADPVQEILAIADNFKFDDTPYIPKAIQGEANLSTVGTSKTKFDSDEVTKLIAARSKASQS